MNTEEDKDPLGDLIAAAQKGQKSIRSDLDPNKGSPEGMLDVVTDEVLSEVIVFFKFKLIEDMYYSELIRNRVSRDQQERDQWSQEGKLKIRCKTPLHILSAHDRLDAVIAACLESTIGRNGCFITGYSWTDADGMQFKITLKEPFTKG